MILASMCPRVFTLDCGKELYQMPASYRRDCRRAGQWVPEPADIASLVQEIKEIGIGPDPSGTPLRSIPDLSRSVPRAPLPGASVGSSGRTVGAESESPRSAGEPFPDTPFTPMERT